MISNPKIIFILLNYFLLISLCFSQTDNKKIPYYILAYNNNDLDFENINVRNFKYYSKYIYIIKNDTFQIIDTLHTNTGLIFNFIEQFSDKGLIYFEESDKAYKYLDKKEKSNYILTFIDYSGDSIILRRYNTESDSTFLNHMNPQCVIIDNQIVLINQWSEKGFNESFGFDKYFRKYKITIDDYQNSYNEGKRAFSRISLFPMSFLYDKNFKRLKMDFENSDNYNPEALFQEPDSLKRKQDRTVWVLVNTDNYMILTDGWETTLPIPYKQELKIYDKKTKQWSKWTYKNYRNITNKDEWLYGSLLDVYFDEDMISKQKAITESFSSRYELMYGAAPEVGFYPGILYLYHLPLKKYIEWKTGDRDSEILTIHNNIIYYRVFDEIRRVNLDTKSNEIDWSSQKVLVKDKKRVPNIHWMFFAPKQDKIEEVWVNKQKEGVKKK